MTGRRLNSLIIAALFLLAWSTAARGQTSVQAGSAFPLEPGVYGETRTLVVRVPFGYEEGEDSYPVLTVADEGGIMQEGVERVAAALEEHAPEGLAWWYDPLPEEHHHTIYIPATLKALRLVFAPEPDQGE